MKPKTKEVVKKQKKSIIDIDEIFLNAVRVGEVEIKSSNTRIQDLCGITLEVLGNLSVQKYLGGIQKRKLAGSYVG